MNEWIDIIREIGSLGLLALVLFKNHETQKELLKQLSVLTEEIRSLKQIVCKS